MNYMTSTQSNSSCKDAEGMSAPSVRAAVSSRCASSASVCNSNVCSGNVCNSNNGAVAVIAAAAFIFVLSLCLFAFIISGIIILSSIIILLAIATLIIIRITIDNRTKRKGNCRA